MMLPHRRPWPWVVILLGGLVFALLVVTRPRPEVPVVQPRVWPVRALVAGLQTLRPTLTLYGQVETPRLMRVAAPGGSRVAEVRVREGMPVEPGQLLLRLDPRDFEPKVTQARADVEELLAQLELERQTHGADREAFGHERALLELSRAQVARLEKLRQRNLGSLAALDQARMDLERQALRVTERRLALAQHAARVARIEARLLRARAVLAEARLDLERSRVSAPFAGIVTELGVAEGDSVQANQHLVSLYPRHALEVRAKIPAPFQTEVVRALAGGDRLPARGESLGVRFGLALRRMAGRAEAGGIDALFGVAGDADGLRPGLPATVALGLPARRNAVPVPYAALYGSDRIYRIEAGRLRAVTVTPLGDFPLPGGRAWLLVQSDALKAGDLILITHLPNAVTGLAVEPEVIPLPEETG